MDTQLIAVDRSGEVHFQKLPVQRLSLQLMKCRCFGHTFSALSIQRPQKGANPAPESIKRIAHGRKRDCSHLGIFCASWSARTSSTLVEDHSAVA
jgi:hypothetical protein